MGENTNNIAIKKGWWQSKTVWVNIVAGIALIAQAVTGTQVMDADQQATILAVINIALRFATKAPIL
jgi:uncharacterized membrane protein